ncbi:protein RFT1 homolog [Aplysia californica]|uniref:Protein RFT1 homolog n=1 Tax=Aplysia californica TaxID=6500 RepID=A0ABM0JXI9_APLCA|nr:protein RFT1 homolog [Aplysia californica]
MQGSAVLSSAAKAASYNMVLQFGLRLTTFVLNAFILRYVSQDTLGIVNVRLTLLYSTSLFLSKEAFDRACLTKPETRDWRQVINLLWCTVPLAGLCCSLLTFVWLHLLDNPADAHYSTGVICFAVSTVIEVLAEPLFVVGQAFLFVKLKVLFLGLSQGVKCGVTVLLVLWRPQWGIGNFAIAQVLSSITYTLLYHGYFAYFISSNKKKMDNFPLQSIRDIYPSVIKDKPFIDRELASLTASFFQQSFLKQILTEGEKYVMTFFDVLSFGDQGIYDVINNLGSMAARFIFLPIEENSYLFFSHMITRGLPMEKQNQDSLKLSARVLGVILKTVTLIGCIILVFGYSNSFLALHLYGGEILSSGNGPRLLRWYCLYVLVIAINGTTEAFVFAAMSKEDVDRYNKKMLLFSGLFLFSSWLLTQWVGSVGFILANCLNMGARIAHSVIFISRYFSTYEHKPLQDVCPSVAVIISLVVSLVITAVSEVTFCVDGTVTDRIIHIAVTALCLLTVLALTFVTEKQLINTIREQMSRGRKDSAQDVKDR